MIQKWYEHSHSYTGWVLKDFLRSFSSQSSQGRRQRESGPIQFRPPVPVNSYFDPWAASSYSLWSIPSRPSAWQLLQALPYSICRYLLPSAPSPLPALSWHLLPTALRLPLTPSSGLSSCHLSHLGNLLITWDWLVLIVMERREARNIWVLDGDNASRRAEHKSLWLSPPGHQVCKIGRFGTTWQAPKTTQGSTQPQKLNCECRL